MICNCIFIWCCYDCNQRIWYFFNCDCHCCWTCFLNDKFNFCNFTPSVVSVLSLCNYIICNIWFNWPSTYVDVFKIVFIFSKSLHQSFFSDRISFCFCNNDIVICNCVFIWCCCYRNRCLWQFFNCDCYCCWACYFNDKLNFCNYAKSAISILSLCNNIICNIWFDCQFCCISAFEVVFIFCESLHQCVFTNRISFCFFYHDVVICNCIFIWCCYNWYCCVWNLFNYDCYCCWTCYCKLNLCHFAYHVVSILTLCYDIIFNIWLDCVCPCFTLFEFIWCFKSLHQCNFTHCISFCFFYHDVVIWNCVFIWCCCNWHCCLCKFFNCDFNCCWACYCEFNFCNYAWHIVCVNSLCDYVICNVWFNCVFFCTCSFEYVFASVESFCNFFWCHCVCFCFSDDDVAVFNCIFIWRCCNWYCCLIQFFNCDCYCCWTCYCELNLCHFACHTICIDSLCYDIIFNIWLNCVCPCFFFIKFIWCFKSL